MSSAAEIAWERVRALKPVIEAHRGEGERLRRLPDVLTRAFLEADLYRLMVPPDMGGLGIDPLTVFDLIDEMASYDASVGWNFAIGVGAPAMLGAQPEAWLRRHFSTPDCGLATSGGPGRAVPVDGGYRLTGKYGWASGVHQAKLAGGFGIVMDGDKPLMKASGGPDVRMFLVPPEQVTILDAWHTGGMRGTGSTEWVAEDLFVPEENTTYAFTETSEHPAPIFRMPIVYFGFNIAPVSLGVARSAVEGLQRLAAQSNDAFRARGAVQYAVAKADALRQSASLFVRDAFGAIWANILEGKPSSLEQKASARASYAHACESAIEAVELCADAAGGAAVFEAWPFERALRDVRAIRGHFMLGRRVLEACGQIMIGAPFDDHYF